MSVRETSLERYRSLESSGALQGQEAVLMRLIHRHFPFPAKFTRRELKEKAGWEMSTIAGRVNGLVTKKYLTEFEHEIRDGGHLLQVTTSQRSPVALAPSLPQSSPAENSQRAVTVPKAASASVLCKIPAAAGLAPVGPVVEADDPVGNSKEIAAAAADVLRVDGFDYKGRPMVRYVMGWGPGWPEDQDHLHIAHRGAA